MNIHLLTNLVYIVAAVLFIYGLKMLASPVTARKGNFVSAIGMLIAVVVTLLSRDIIDYKWIAIGIVTGSIIGAFSARLVAMTQMPQMVALFNGFGGITSLLVGWATYHVMTTFDLFTTTTIFLAVLIGGVTFSGSLVAWGKLATYISGRPILFPGQTYLNGTLFIGTLVAGSLLLMNLQNGYSYSYAIFIGIIILSLLLGILVVIPIGGADMPVVISLLNSYSGIAGCATGLAIQNNILIVAGALVGASGIILTNVMCKAMNRSIANVLFGGFGATATKGVVEVEGEVKPISAEDTYFVLEAASSVVFVPGYGMAVAQAQHALRELGDIVEENGSEVRYAIHPVAGRMPGHMNVLLAEANVSYDKLIEMEDINRTIASVDVCVVIGANDVVNPAARESKSSPIYGMPVINVDKAKTVIVLKRSMAPGFAGIDNNLFYKENTRMLFGDAKSSVEAIVSEFKKS
ncbi:MAG: NAD(P)(+) transhydrogenase (Re/Si-specific) subunit beta [Thermodesulfobacteriota bacterium]|nr:NAD(P)(+) transhydrogenase (Re/Si-specific) subunit beta [Thermodesulfobacteriota bacterium]